MRDQFAAVTPDLSPLARSIHRAFEPTQTGFAQALLVFSAGAPDQIRFQSVPLKQDPWDVMEEIEGAGGQVLIALDRRQGPEFFSRNREIVSLKRFEGNPELRVGSSEPANDRRGGRALDF